MRPVTMSHVLLLNAKQERKNKPKQNENCGQGGKRVTGQNHLLPNSPQCDPYTSATMKSPKMHGDGKTLWHNLLPTQKGFNKIASHVEDCRVAAIKVCCLWFQNRQLIHPCRLCKETKAFKYSL